MKRFPFRAFASTSFLVVIPALTVIAQQSPLSLLATPVTDSNLDPAAFVQWVDGSEKPIMDGRRIPRRPETAIWTTTPHFLYPALIYGPSKAPGIRYLRIGFKKQILVGSVLVHGGGQLSVLKSDAPYPGILTDDSQWIPAQRLNSGSVSTEEVDSRHDALWVLPSVTQTRALRFSHLARVSDPIYGGTFNGAYLLSERVANLAPQAIATTKSRLGNAGQLNDESDNGSGAWDNIPPNGDRLMTLADDPEWVILTWPHPVTINGLASLGTGFSAADVQIYTGPADIRPTGDSERNWKTIKTVSGWKSLYPGILQVHWIDFGGPLTTRAVSLRLTMSLNEKEVHPQLASKTVNGKRVWLDQLMALKSLDSAPLTTIAPQTTSASSSQKVSTSKSPVPIAINFTLPEDGFVTLVIDDSSGKRVRNLIADTPFPKGKSAVSWDGTDDLKRDVDAANHGLYNVPSELVVPGTYQVRGLWHRPIDLNYEFSVYSPGDPPWPTLDNAGGWMTNHTPASSCVFIPGGKAPGGQPLIGIGAYISEGGSAFSWVNLDGKKIGGRGWIGGVWTGAQYLAGDSGLGAETNVSAYVGSVFEGNQRYGVNGKVEIRLTKLTTLVPAGDQPVLKSTLMVDPLPLGSNTQSTSVTGSKPVEYLGGLAVWNGLLVVSETSLNKLVFIDAKAGKIVGEASASSPGALAFDSQGRLLLLSAQNLIRYSGISLTKPLDLAAPEKLITGLEHPRGIAVDAADRIYIADQGSSNQVKVFSPKGVALYSVGHPGPSMGGLYDPLHMNQPKGLAVDSNGRIWVTEESYQPKRVSVWNPDGSLWKAYYGPAQYGGGGAIDALDSSRFSYEGMEFHIDWDKGTSALTRVFYEPNASDLTLGLRSAPPEMALHFNNKRYMTNAFNSSPTGGRHTAFLFLDKGDGVVPVAAIGSANEWDVLKANAFKSIWPTGINLNGDSLKNQAMFVWSDLNGDAQVQTNEVKMWAASNGGVTVSQDGSFIVNNVYSGSGPGHVERFRPTRFTRVGVPVYDDQKIEVLGDSQGPVSSGGDQALVGTEGWTVVTNAPPPYSPYGLGGIKNGVAMWSYPSLWPGLHASHNSPPPDHPGELIGTTRLLGDFVTPRNSDAGPLFFMNGNQGNIYVFTQDGLFVTQLFRDVRQGMLWEMPVAQRGMHLNDITLHDENFFPTVTQIPDGGIYIESGALSALVKVNGLESIHRLPSFPVSVSSDDLKRTEGLAAYREGARQGTIGANILEIALLNQAPPMNGNPDSLAGDIHWAQIDHRGTAAYFNSNNKPYDVQGAVMIADGKLFALWKTSDPQLLKNSGEIENAPFKTGGALDLMIGTDPKADTKRIQPVAGDLRLLVTQVNSKTKAVLYRAVVPGTPISQRVRFYAPWNGISFDSVTDVSNQVQLAVDGKGDFEVAVPLDLLGLMPQDGLKIKGDIGILRGDGAQTTQRIYWNNKATAIVSDVPTEAMLTPGLWGIWEFQSK